MRKFESRILRQLKPALTRLDSLSGPVLHKVRSLSGSLAIASVVAWSIFGRPQRTPCAGHLTQVDLDQLSTRDGFIDLAVVRASNPTGAVRSRPVAPSRPLRTLS